MKRNKSSWKENGFEEWGGYMEAKKLKLEEQYAEAAGLGQKISDIFKGIAIFVNGLTDPSANELRFLMMKHGGQYHHYYSSERTTHIIASNLPDSKVKQIKNLKVVKPLWIVDSIEAGKLLNYTDYLLCSNQSRTQPTLKFSNPCVLKVAEQSSCKTVAQSCGEKEADSSASKSNIKAAKNATDVNFLSEFYSNSRLHLISTMGAMFKEYINKLRSNSKHEFPGLEMLKKEISRTAKVNNDDFYQEDISEKLIMHIDMDCFFVSVGIRNRPALKGLPVVVTHAKGNRPQTHAREGADPKLEAKLYVKRFEERHKKNIELNSNHWSNSINETDSMAEIASCSYEARKFGIKNGMFLGQALKLCPNLKTIPYVFEDYKEVSFNLYDTVARYTLNIEAVSCDEMLVDCSDIISATSSSPLDFATVLRKEIKEKTGCPCSTGFGSNRLQARLATRKAKPDGQFVLSPEDVQEFMNSVKISDLPGVGRSISYKLHSMGARTCGELQSFSLQKLQSEFGNKLGETLYKSARGLDDKGLNFTKVRKSVSAEVNYGIRFKNDTERDKFLNQLSEEVSNRLAEVEMKGRCITLKIMVKSKDAPEETAKYMGHGLCDYITKSCTLPSPVSDAKSIMKEVLAIVNNLSVKAKDLRGIGIQVTRLEKNTKINSLKDFFNRKKKENAPPLKSEPKESKKSSNNLVDNSVECERMKDYQNANVASTSKSLKISKSCQNSLDLSFSQVDPDFLKELPENLRREILANLRVKNHACTTSKQSEEGTANKMEICKDSKTSDKNTEECDNDKSESYITPHEMRTMMKEWVRLNDIPQSCDVSMFSGYLQQLVTSRQIDKLHPLIKSFYWCILHGGKASSWKEAYSQIIEQVQIVMLEVYGGKLMIKEKFHV